MMVDTVLFSRQTDEWETPKDLFDKLDAIWQFDLDPCATEENHKCAEYFTQAEDGLTRNWHIVYKSAFVNPPYSQIAKWVLKAWVEAHFGGMISVLLIPARTDTKWFHEFAPAATAIYFIKGRVKFVGGKASAPFPSMVVVFGRAVTPEIEGQLRVRL